jgi:hypothetical protein
VLAESVPERVHRKKGCVRVGMKRSGVVCWRSPLLRVCKQGGMVFELAGADCVTLYSGVLKEPACEKWKNSVESGSCAS